MATARIIHRWDDGAALVCEVTVKASYPDAIDEARAQVVTMFRAALEVTSDLDERANDG